MAGLRRFLCCTLPLAPALLLPAQSLASQSLSAQPPPAAAPLSLVLPSAPGRIVLPVDPQLEFQRLAVYDNGQRPVAQFADSRTGITLSYILFANRSGTPTAAGCREAGVGPIERRFGAAVSSLRQSPAGKLPATTFYLLDTVNGARVRQGNLFGFVGNAETCIEVHASKVNYTPADAAALNAPLAALVADPAYAPSPKDRFEFGSVLLRLDPAAAAPFFRSALATLPAGPAVRDSRRIVTDQLALSLALSDQLVESRAVLDTAIAADPDYPVNYYNLACADAQHGDAANARLHLQQAFDRRADTLKGERLPDPTKDESLQKLRKDKTFWDFAKALPHSKPPASTKPAP